MLEVKQVDVITSADDLPKLGLDMLVAKLLVGK